MAEKRAKDKGKAKIIEDPMDQIRKHDAEMFKKILEERWAKNKGKLKIGVEKPEATKPDSQQKRQFFPERWAKDKGKLKIDSDSDSDSEDEVRSQSSTSRFLVPPEMETMEEIPLPPNAKLLTNSEATEGLKRAKKSLSSLELPKFKVVMALDTALQYLQDAVRYADACVPNVRSCFKSLNVRDDDTDSDSD